MQMVDAQKAGRRKYITKDAVERHGATPGCSACAGEGGAHLLRCRDRFERLFKEESAGRAPEARAPAESAGEPRETEEKGREAAEVPAGEQEPEGAEPAPSASAGAEDRPARWGRRRRSRETRPAANALAATEWKTRQELAQRALRREYNRHRRQGPRLPEWAIVAVSLRRDRILAATRCPRANGSAA